MRELQQLEGGRRGPGRLHLMAGLALALAVLPAIAEVSHSLGDCDLQAVGGDETIGTLPILTGTGNELDIQRVWRGLRPAFYLEGSPDELTNVILQAHGAGSIVAQVVDSSTGRTRLIFQGDVQVILDRMTFDSSSLSTGLAIPRAFGQGQLMVRLGTRSATRLDAVPGFMSLPVARMESTGALESAGIQILTAGRSSGRTLHRIDATPDVLILSQTY